uniref:Uncharacterized protein n=1 Tax=Cacopsylla melanoneura TaxID=428564 RepID=A0A8D9ABT2_9HEMI
MTIWAGTLTEAKRKRCVMSEESSCVVVHGIRSIAPDLLYTGLIRTRVEKRGLCSLRGTWIIGSKGPAPLFPLFWTRPHSWRRNLVPSRNSITPTSIVSSLRRTI